MSLSADQVVERLAAMGYFKFAPDQNGVGGRYHLLSALKDGYLGGDWEKNCVTKDKRTYPADSEELAEGRIAEFILLMRDALAHEGVDLTSVEDDFRDDGYDVRINGRAYPVSRASAQGGHSSWAVATRRFMEIVNELLEAAGSKERLYGMYGGNEGRAVLLTEEMFDLLRFSQLISDPGEFLFPSTAIGDDGSIRR
jgi:hypothetical protein